MTPTTQIRYGSGPLDKVRVASITQQQIAELADYTGLTQAGVMQEAVARLYMTVIYNEQVNLITDLRKENEKLYAALCAATGDE